MQGTVWFARVEGHKTAHRGKDRLLFFGPQAQAILRSYIKLTSQAPLFDYTVSGYRSAIKRACKRLGIPSWSGHWLRHTASTSIRDQFGVEGAQTVLGHSRVSTTELYAQKSFRLAVEIMERVG